MNANLGGTELQPALRQIFHSRSREHPTSVFVVTDGEVRAGALNQCMKLTESYQVHDIQETTREVAEAVRAAEPSKPLRVFMLGIGEQASLDECKEIARAGNGLCLMALSADNILPNCMKLLRASSKFILKNVEIDWRIPARLMQDSEDIVIQVPHHIEAIYPDLRFVANAIITSEEYIIPDFVVIRGQRDGKGEVVEIRVPVIVIQEVVEGENPLIGTIAARRYMDDLRDSPRPGFRTHSRTRATVVQFGEQYQLESRYTSFVPIVRTIPPSKPKASWQGIRHQLDSKLTKLSKRMRNPNVARSETRGVAPLPSFSALQITADTEGGVELEADVWELSRDDDDYDGIESPVRNIEVTSRSPVAGPSRSAYADAGHLSLPDSSLWAVRSNTPQEHYFPAIPALMGTSTTKLASQPSDPGIHSVESPREEESSSPPRSPSEQLATPDIRLGRSRTEKWRSKMHWLRWKPFPMFPPSSGLHASVRDRSLATALPHIPAVLVYNAPDKPWVTVSEGVSDMEDGRNRAWELVGLQAFNGAFSPGNSFIEIIGEEAVRMGRESGSDEILWATALAVIYLERKLIDESALQGSLEKAIRAGRLLCDSPRHFEIVLQRARGMRF